MTDIARHVIAIGCIALAVVLMAAAGAEPDLGIALTLSWFVAFPLFVLGLGLELWTEVAR